MSIFARQMLSESSLKPKATLRSPAASENVGSSIIKDAKMAQEIHEENLNLLSQMSEQDILAEREKLLASLGMLYDSQLRVFIHFPEFILQIHH